MKRLIVLFSLTLSIQVISKGQNTFESTTTSTHETKQEELSKDLINYLDNNKYSQAEIIFNKIVNNKEYHNVLTYSEWLYCSLIFKREELFLQNIHKNDYRYVESESEQKKEEFRYQLSINILKNHYKEHFEEIYNYIKNTDINDQEDLNMLVLFFGATNPKNKSTQKYEQKEIIEKYRQEHKKSRYDSYLIWLKDEVNGRNKYSNVKYKQTTPKNFSQMNYLAIGVRKFIPQSNLFESGNGITFSVGYSHKEFYIDWSLNLSSHISNDINMLQSEDGEIIDINRNSTYNFNNQNIGLGGILALGNSQIIILGRIGYSSITTKKKKENYKLASNISFSPAAKLNLCLKNRDIINESDKPFKIYLSSEIGYNASIISFQKENNSNGVYMQIGLCFSF